jgi:hypothetical protein
MITAKRPGSWSALPALAAHGEDRHKSLLDRLAQVPRCPLTRYLLGCDEWDRDRPASATRHFMIAYHAEPRLGSAALLVFAGLTYISRPGGSLLAALDQAWTEFRRPAFDVSRRERRLLDAFHEPVPGGAPVRPEYGRYWRLPIARLRAELRSAWLAA